MTIEWSEDKWRIEKKVYQKLYDYLSKKLFYRHDEYFKFIVDNKKELLQLLKEGHLEEPKAPRAFEKESKFILGNK